MVTNKMVQLGEITSEDKWAHTLSRREFIKVAFLVTGGMGLSLVGCTPVGGQSTQVDGPLAIIDDWILALNGEDRSRFEKLHLDSVIGTTFSKDETYEGFQAVWDIYLKSNGGQIEKLVSFGREGSYCLVANATKFDRSLCYVFTIRDDVITRVYEYDSGYFDLANSDHFSGFDFKADEADLSKHLAAMDTMFVVAANKRDFSAPDVEESAIMFVPTSSEPLVGKETIQKDGEDYTSFYSSVVHKSIGTFGQGNLVCTHLISDGAPKGSLCFVGEFTGAKISKLYEFWSEAESA
jgi:hypothetical protein